MHLIRAIVGTTAELLTVSLLVLQSLNRHESIDTNRDQLTDVYDYIIVGSGSAGAIVAHRLAEDGNTTVLLLEAGGPTCAANDIPAQATTGKQFNSMYDWNYTMEAQHVGRAFLNQEISENRGFTIGGSSSINTMIFNRGNRRDYDAWAHEYGAVGWDYINLLPFFTKYEGNRDPHIVNQNSGFHSATGRIGITSWANPDPLLLQHEKILNKEAGIRSTDINGPNQVGTQIAQAFIDTNGIRSSASNAYIDPNPFPHNLHIISRTLVTKIIVKNDTAVGVLLEREGRGYKVMSKKEVILCGGMSGVYGSPQLLMLSGIGPKEHLQKLNISVIKDLPVGNNLQNHPGVVFWFAIKQESLKFINFAGQLNMALMYQWFTTGTGPLAAHHREVTYFSTFSNPDKNWPNVGWETTVYRFPENLTEFTQFQYQDQNAWNLHMKNYLGRYYLFVHTILQRVRSRGVVRLRSLDAHAPPIIKTNFFQDPLDYKDQFEMIKTVLQFYEVSSMSQHLEPLIPIPGCKLCPNKPYVSECDSYINCTIEQVLYSSYHPVGTCRMGDPKRDDVVVDPYLRVKGINNLRVCDASINPLLQNSNTNAAALMVGEKCAHIIKDQSDYK